MNNVTKWFYTHKISSAFIIVVLAVLVMVYKPYKISDPSSPLFVESWFRLSDYNFRQQALVVDLEKLLPIGTPMGKVDRLLVQYGGAVKTDQTNYDEGKYSYTWKPFYLARTPDQLSIKVYYTPNNKLRMIYFGHTLINTAPNHYTGE